MRGQPKPRYRTLGRGRGGSPPLAIRTSLHRVLVASSRRARKRSTASTWSDPEMSGALCFEGTRLPVSAPVRSSSSCPRCRCRRAWVSPAARRRDHRGRCCRCPRGARRSRDSARASGRWGRAKPGTRTLGPAAAGDLPDGQDRAFWVAGRQLLVSAIGDEVERFEHQLADQDLADSSLGPGGSVFTVAGGSVFTVA